jgi:hypothetical protein
MTGHVLKVDDFTWDIILEIQRQVKNKHGFEVGYAQVVRKQFHEGNPEKVFNVDLSAVLKKTEKKVRPQKVAPPETQPSPESQFIAQPVQPLPKQS